MKPYYEHAGCACGCHAPVAKGRRFVWLALWALLHDAAEAYIGDINSPLKRLLGSSIKEIEKRIERAVFGALGMVGDIPEDVKIVDLRMLATEARDLMPNKPRDWNLPYEPYWFIAEPHAAEVDERDFLKSFHKLRREVMR